MALESLNKPIESKINEGELSWEVSSYIEDVNNTLDSTLSASSEVYYLVKEIESNIKWYRFRQDTLDYIFKKYPSMSVDEFKWYFLTGIYNKNILSNYPEVIDLLDFDNIEPWEDLISIVISKVSLHEKDFHKSIDWVFDKITIPNMTSTDVAQWYFKWKLEESLPWTEVIFGDMDWIKENIWYNQFWADSVWFIDMMWNWLLNSCLFKLLKTNPDLSKVSDINDIFWSLEKDVFLWWSTYVIPFETPEELEVVKMPKQPMNNNPLEFWKKWVLLNSMWYLNSAYYAHKVKWTFVLWSHNIAEPMHAGKLTVINNELENRYNHNWLISYFWEKSGLLMYNKPNLENNDDLQEFLSISNEEVIKRNDDFKKLYESEIKPLVYGVFHKYLSKKFPNIIKKI